MQAISPSSSTTTPSPSLSFLHPVDAPDTLQLADLDPQEREDRQRAVQKLLARAEYSKLTRGLRARLAYASYKATNNLSHVPLPVLEDRIHDSSPSPAPSPSPVPLPPSTPYSPAHKRRAAMAPPVSPARSLYASLLGPPPSKRPRHVYGPATGPTPADLLPSYTLPAPATPRKVPPTSPHRTLHAHVHSPLTPHGRTVRTVLQSRARSTVTEKEDMNAAATLTALMFNRASPRQQQQHQQHQQHRGNDDDGHAHPPRTSTPVPLMSSQGKATEDADAAELMLYLATSPSPARPTVARRAPGSMGRVLFAGAGAGVGGSRSEGDMHSLSGMSMGTGGTTTPALTVGPSSSSQETNATANTNAMTVAATMPPAPTQLLPPPPSPSLALARSPSLGASGVPASGASATTSSFDVSRRLFVDEDETQGSRVSGETRFGLGKGIDLVEAK